MHNRILTLNFAIVIAFFPIARAHDLRSINYKEECVGRMRFLLPDEAEVAAVLAKDFQRELDGGVPQPPFRFVDGQRANSSHIRYGGSLVVTHPISDAERENFLKYATLTQQDVGRAIQQSTANSTPSSRFEKLSTGKQSGVAWSVDTSYMAYFDVANHSVLWRVNGRADDMSDIIRDYQNILNGMTARSMFSVPNRTGVCLPSIFIADNGRTFRDVGTTFRLRSHPDLLILIADKSATKPALLTVRGAKEPIEELNNFWAQYEGSYTAKEVRSAWSNPSTRRVTFGDRAAVSSFVRITRSNGTVDFGYLAVAGGDANADFDTPRLKMYVIREAKLAEQKGVQPTSEEELLAIAHKIGSSIKPIVSSR